MGVFESDKLLDGPVEFIPEIVKKICEVFTEDGYETCAQGTATGGFDISLHKGGIFKAVLGMKTALKVMVVPKEEQIYIKAGVGIFGLQALPTAVALFIAWPVIIAQIWGMVQQSKMDDKVINIAEEELNRLIQQKAQQYAMPEEPVEPEKVVYCANCGSPLISKAKFCVKCGSKVEEEE